MKNLLSALKGARPEIRYFTLLWSRFYDPHIELVTPVLTMAKTIGVSKDVVSTSLSYLTEFGFFDKQHGQLHSKVGRPSSKHLATDKLLAILSEDEAPKLHAKLIDELLDMQGLESDHSNLKLSNRLLLCVFLLHADQFGLIQDLGFATISKLTGMSRDQFNSQLLKLTNLGYIKLITTGMTSKLIFGSKPSIYMVNVTCEYFAHANFRSLTCENTFSHEDIFTNLIQRSTAGLTEYSAWQRSNEKDKVNRKNFFELKKSEFFRIVDVDNAERCWRLFYEFHRIVLKRFMFEKILLLAAQQVIFKQEINDDLRYRLVNELRIELIPRSNKPNYTTAITGVIPVTGELIDTPGAETSDLRDTFDFDIFSEVLITSVVFPFMKIFQSNLKILENHFGVKFSSGYWTLNADDHNPYRSPRSFVLLYPADSDHIVHRVSIDRGK
ncbi:hypothetical protein ACRWQN_02775 [Shewanella sp. HL-SH8]|uniref:hypothetical protein n=1 Tax=Shewanella sp. HL-SH8 TaxID=3436242 RepID=UPI003EB6D77F